MLLNYTRFILSPPTQQILPFNLWGNDKLTPFCWNLCIEIDERASCFITVITIWAVCYCCSPSIWYTNEWKGFFSLEKWWHLTICCLSFTSTLFLSEKNILIINFTFVDIEWMIDTPFDTKIFQNACMSNGMDGRVYCNSLIGWSWSWRSSILDGKMSVCRPLHCVGEHENGFRFLNIAIKLSRRFIMGSWMVADIVTAKWASPVHQLVIVGTSDCWLPI